MLFPPYKSSNGHTVSVYGRLLFHVTSASRKKLFHTVDLEGFEHWKTVCNCEAWKYGTRPCRHIAASFEAIAHWAGVPEEIAGDFVERLMFLLQVGQSFNEAILSCLDHHKSHHEKADSDRNRDTKTSTGVARQGSEGLGEKPKRIYRLAPRKGAGPEVVGKSVKARKDSGKAH